MISIAHSPDNDDFFMFWALRNKLIDTKGFEFEFVELDTGELNAAATRAEYDIVAVSVACLPTVLDHYLVLPHGASVGRGYGPTIVSNQTFSPNELDKKRIGVPGESTTAAALTRLVAPNGKFSNVPVKPYSAAFDAIAENLVDACVLIHEGQTSYSQQGMHLILDLGQWWLKERQLPLPLGVNLIANKIDPETRCTLSQLIQDSIDWALEHQQALLPQLEKLNLTRGIENFGQQQINDYLRRYANEDTQSFKDDAKKALSVLLEITQGYKQNIPFQVN